MGHKFNRNMHVLNKLSVVHFKGSAQLTQFSLAEHKLYRVVSLSIVYKLYHGSNFKLHVRSLKELSSMEQYEI